MMDPIQTLRAKIIVITQFRDAVRQVSIPYVYGGDVAVRDEKLRVILEVLENLEDQLDDLLTAEEENDEDDEDEEAEKS
jgi:hypothetical protein